MRWAGRDLFSAARAALQDAAWPVPWRVSHRDVMDAAEALRDGRSYTFAGCVWVWREGAVVRESYSHERWREWFEAGNALCAREDRQHSASVSAALGLEVGRWTDWVDIKTVATLPDHFQAKVSDGRTWVRWRLQVIQDVNEIPVEVGDV